MGVEKYQTRGKTFWRVDEWLNLPDGRVVRFRQKKIPTREQAMAIAAKRKTEAFEGRFFDRAKAPTLTVAEVWAMYQPDLEARQRHVADRGSTGESPPSARWCEEGDPAHGG